MSDLTQNEEATGYLSVIPFEDVIGGPLVAAIQAQAQAASTTVDFIQDVAFTTNEEGQVEPINVTFTYENNGTQSSITVPILSIIPIPYLRIDEVNLDFKAMLKGKEKSSESSLDIDNKTKAKGSMKGWVPVKKFDASFSTQTDIEKAKESGKVEAEYNRNVSVRASHNEMPAGMAKVLGILNNSITTNVPTGKLNLNLDTTSPTSTSTSLHLLAIGSDFEPIAGLALNADLFSLTSSTALNNLSYSIISTNSDDKTDANGEISIKIEYDAPTEAIQVEFSTGNQSYNDRSLSGKISFEVPN